MDKKDLPPEYNTDLYLADILLRLTVLEKMLFDKNILNKEEYAKELEAIAAKASKEILKTVDRSKDIQEFLDNLEEKARNAHPKKIS